MDAETRPAWVVPERLALLLVAMAFVASLFSRALQWDWLMDTLFLALAVVLVVRGSGDGQVRGAGDVQTQPVEAGRRWPVLVCGYLCADSVFLLLIGLRGSILVAVYYFVLSVLYGQALRLRMQRTLPAKVSTWWGVLFTPPFRVVSGLSLLALVCMFLPMTEVFNGFTAWSGPMVMHLPGTVHMDPGHTVRIGGMVWRYGYQVALGHPVCLLLIGILLLPVMRAAGLIQTERGVRVLQWSTVAILLWWMLFARGFQSLRYPATPVFAVAVVALTILMFRGGQPTTGAAVSSSVGRG